MIFKSFCTWDDTALVINILLKPSSTFDAIVKVVGTQLKVNVTAKPLGGKATDHLIQLLAEAFGVTPTDIEVVYGQASVNKQLRIQFPKKLPKIVADHLAAIKK